MGHSGLPKEVSEFVERHLRTGAQAEVLVLVVREQQSAWTPAAVGRELRIGPEHAEDLLASLRASGLLRKEGDAYQYAPRTEQLSAATEAFVAAYPIYRVAINSLIFSKPRPSLRDFSDAFRLRGDDD